MLKALKFLDISILDQTFELLNGTFGAESVLAIELYCVQITFFNLFIRCDDLISVADWTIVWFILLLRHIFAILLILHLLLNSVSGLRYLLLESSDHRLSNRVGFLLGLLLWHLSMR